VVKKKKKDNLGQKWYSFIIPSMENLVSLYMAAGATEKARKISKEALNFRFFKEHNDETLEHLAVMQLSLGDLLMAEELGDMLLDRCRENEKWLSSTKNNERYKAGSRLEMARILDILAATNFSLYEMDKARKHQRSLALYEEALGSQHPEVAGSLALQSCTMMVGKAYTAAKGTLSTATAILNRVSGMEHPLVAQLKVLQAFCHFNLDEVEKARDCMGSALSIYEKTYDGAHLQVAAVQGHLAIFLLASGKYEEAIEMSEQAQDTHTNLKDSLMNKKKHQKNTGTGIPDFSLRHFVTISHRRWWHSNDPKISLQPLQICLEFPAHESLFFDILTLKKDISDSEMTQKCKKLEQEAGKILHGGFRHTGWKAF